MNFRRPFLILIILFVCLPAAAESLREYHQRQCVDGKVESCKRAEAMLEGEQHAERIVELGDDFALKLDRSTLEEENKPALLEAYPLVLDDYFKLELEKGIKNTLSNDVMELCAEHFHNHWRNRKLWWPTDEAGKPDWSTIYYYIVEHYYGYCVRSIL
ncbi:MAG: hypothetical protein HND53_08625 [Proteobacteria bacterium]|nr:hypothetical protein [Pseudomonadota bacterium]NOG60547.1 hypothetical protein [Pseudomonadota bacterium]